MTYMSTATMDRAMQAAYRIIQDLSEAKAHSRTGDNSRMRECLAGAEVNFETIGLAMGRKVLDRESEVA
jgi:hypothetical protein